MTTKQALRSLRTPLAWALLAYTAFWTVNNVAYWLLSRSMLDMSERALGLSFGGLVQLVAPLAAVVIAAMGEPVARARRIATIALVTYWTTAVLQTTLIPAALNSDFVGTFTRMGMGSQSLAATVLSGYSIEVLVDMAALVFGAVLTARLRKSLKPVPAAAEPDSLQLSVDAA